MQPHEALDVAAQVAVTLAGFAGIVVVFRPESVHQWSDLDKLRLRLLLYNAAYPLSYSLFGILLLSIDPPPVAIWRWCSAFGLLAQVPGAISFRLSGHGIPSRGMDGATKALFYSLFVIGIISIVLQLVNIAAWNRFWPFFFAIFFHLIAAMLQFLRIVLLPAEKLPMK